MYVLVTSRSTFAGQATGAHREYGRFYFGQIFDHYRVSGKGSGQQHTDRWSTGNVCRRHRLRERRERRQMHGVVMTCPVA